MTAETLDGFDTAINGMKHSVSYVDASRENEIPPAERLELVTNASAFHVDRISSNIAMLKVGGLKNIDHYKDDSQVDIMLQLVIDQVKHDVEAIEYFIGADLTLLRHAPGNHIPALDTHIG